MAILHKNISAEGDIHNPKWFSGANNGDVAWRNELGVLESTDELVLPAALNFVDGSVAPPTSNSGDIYVLSSGASVNAGWGTVALGDWVRYDGAAWNVITPQKSTLCYNETTDALNSYDGSTWSAIGSGGGGGASIYTANDTIGTGRVATLTDSLTFKDGTVNVQGTGTSTGSALSIYNNDTTPVKLWDFLDNGNVSLGVDSAVNTGNNTLTIDGSGATTSNKKIFVVNKPSGEALSVDEDGDFLVNGSIKNGTYFGVESTQKGYWYHGTIREIQIGKTSTTTRTRFNQYGTSFFNNSNIELHRIGLSGGGTGQYMSLFKTGFGAGQRFLLGGTTLIGSEDISLQGDTLLNANVNMPNLPTSATGLSIGDLWNDGGTLKIA